MRGHYILGVLERERERAGKQDYRPVLGIPTKELIVLLP